MKKQTRILAIGAHPDDIEYGCGGFLLKCTDAGHEVYLSVLTDGSATTDTDRKSEQEKSAEFLGAKDLFWGDFPDTGMAPNRELIVSIESTLHAVEPDMVLVNSPGDAHQDHEALASCATTACRYIKRVLYYHDYTTLNMQADTFVDIEGVLDRKRELLACHSSQVDKRYPTGLDLLESVGALAAYYGFMAKVRYAEAFRPLRNLMEI